ncbi:hypothetical protein U1Q18_050977, partial [Sarracenia purpurea var. burkii]
MEDTTYTVQSEYTLDIRLSIRAASKKQRCRAVEMEESAFARVENKRRNVVNEYG